MAEDIKEKFRNLWTELKAGNWDYLLDAVAARLPSWLFSYYHCVLVVTDKIDLPVVEQPGFFKRFITLDDLDRLEEFGTPKGLTRARLKAGYRAAIVGKGDEIMSIVWGAPGNDRYPGEDGFILYRAYTRRDYRQRGLVYIAYQELYDSYAAEGKYLAYGVINRLNKRSFVVHKKFNFKDVGDFIYMTLFGLGLCIYSKWPFPTSKIQLFLKKPPHNKRLWFLP